jgi:surface antigen
MKFHKIAAIAVIALVVSACANSEHGQKETAGTLLGAIGGALLGSTIGGGTGQLVAVAAGTMAGAWIGNEIGKSLDRADRTALGQAQETAYASPVGEPISWNNPDSGNYGTVTPIRDGTDNQTGNYCREFQNEVIINGRVEQAYGTACRQPDGSWRIVQ